MVKTAGYPWLNSVNHGKNGWLTMVELARNLSLSPRTGNFLWDRYYCQNHHFMQVFRHTGEFPFHRISVEEQMSVLTISTSWKPKSGYPMSDWNIVWLDDTEWVPGDDLIVAYGALPHGFCPPRADWHPKRTQQLLDFV